MSVAANDLETARKHQGQAAARIRARRSSTGEDIYGRGAVELAVLGAEIANAAKAVDFEVKLDAAVTAVSGEPFKDPMTGSVIDGGWFGLLPRLNAIAPPGHMRLAELHSRAREYQAAAETYWQQQRAKWTDLNTAAKAFLADSKAQEMLQPLLAEFNIPPLHSLPANYALSAARRVVTALRRAQGQKSNSRASAETLQITDEETMFIADKLLDQALADPKMRAAMERSIQEEGRTTPLTELSRLYLKAYMIKAIIADLLARAKTNQPLDPAWLPDALVLQVLADPEAQPLLIRHMADLNLGGTLANLTPLSKRAIVRDLITAGHLRLRALGS
jgi:hypothetical protein